jgi:HEAT repeat protein
MTVAATWTFSVLLSVCLLVAVLIVVTRTARLLRSARRTRLAAAPRRALLALAADGYQSGEMDGLVALPPRYWRAVAPVAIAMLSKVRGDGLAALAAVFERRGEIARELRALRARGAVRRARAAEVLGGVRCAAAVPGLIALLHDRRAEVRLVAVRALGRIGDPAAAQPLLDCLARAEATPANLVTQALVELGAGAGPALVAALDHAEARVRLAALSAMRLAGTVSAEARVAAALADDPSIEVRVAAAALLGRLGTGSAAAPLLAATDPAQPATVRAEACRALGELGATAAVAPLLDLLDDPAYPVAHGAASALAALGEAGRAGIRQASRRRSAAGAHAREALALAALAP